MLEYQKLDIELNKLKRTNANSVERSNMAKLKDYIIDAQDKGMKLETGAKDLLNDYNKLRKQYEANCDKVQKLTNTDLTKISIDEVDEILSTINSLSSELFFLERNINIIITKIKDSLKDFDTAKQNIIKAKQKYNIFKSKYEQDVKSVLPRVKEIEEQMATMEKTLNPELLAKYKTAKADKIFPVFVPFNNGHCAGCRVEIPTAKANKLKTDGTIVCECHRIIYMP